MSEIKRQTIISGNYSLKGFEEDGLTYGASPIKEVELYSVQAPQPNIEYVWDFSLIGHSIEPETLFAYNSTGIANNDSFLIRIRDTVTNLIIWELELAGNKNIVGNAFFFEFPHLYVSTRHKASLLSAVALDSFTVFAHKTYMIEPYYSPNYTM